MEWTTTLFSAAIALPAAALIKYGALTFIERSHRKSMHQALTETIKKNMRQDIIDRIDYVTMTTITKVMHGSTFEVRDEEGNLIGEIGRTDSFQKARGTDNEIATADR